MLGASVFMTAFLWYKLGSSSEYRGTGSVERFDRYDDENGSDQREDVDQKDKEMAGGGGDVAQQSSTVQTVVGK